MADHKKIQQLDLNLLKVFEALYAEQNMTRAAQSLFITPSAVSHAIKRLRGTLDDLLFERKGQLMLPTPKCERMAPRLIETLHQLQHILQQCGEFDPQETTQSFSIAVPTSLESLFVPKIYFKIAPLIPKATVSFINLKRDHISRQLAFGEVDVAIDVSRPVKAPVLHRKLSGDPLVVLASNAFHPQKLTQQAYLDGDHVTVSNRPVGRVLEDFGLLEKGLNRNIKMRCQNYQTASDIVASTNLLLTLPSVYAARLINPETHILPVPFEIPTIETHLYWHETNGRDEAMMWLREQIMDALKP